MLERLKDQDLECRCIEARCDYQHNYTGARPTDQLQRSRAHTDGYMSSEAESKRAAQIDSPAATATAGRARVLQRLPTHNRSTCAFPPLVALFALLSCTYRAHRPHATTQRSLWSGRTMPHPEGIIGRRGARGHATSRSKEWRGRAGLWPAERAGSPA